MVLDAIIKGASTMSMIFVDEVCCPRPDDLADVAEARGTINAFWPPAQRMSS
jgi:hypothetical protein